jgi:hypothetical protein
LSDGKSAAEGILTATEQTFNSSSVSPVRSFPNTIAVSPPAVLNENEAKSSGVIPHALRFSPTRRVVPAAMQQSATAAFNPVIEGSKKRARCHIVPA